MSKDPLYEIDFYAWAMHQSALLREGDRTELDVENLAEEIESLGKSQQRELESRLHVLLMHLLKWCYQPVGRQRSRSWQRTIMTQRLDLELLLRDNPSFWARLSNTLTERYPRARTHAARETGLPLATFPVVCPWTGEQVLDDEFWPAK